MLNVQRNRNTPGPRSLQHTHAAGHPIGEELGCLTCRALLVLSTEKAITELNWNHLWDGGGSAPVFKTGVTEPFRELTDWTSLKKLGGELELVDPNKKNHGSTDLRRRQNYTNAIQHIMPGAAHMQRKHWPEAVSEFKNAIYRVEQEGAKLPPLYNEAEYIVFERSNPTAGENTMLPTLTKYLHAGLAEAKTFAATPEAQEEHEIRQHESCRSEIIYQQCMNLDSHTLISEALIKMQNLQEQAFAVYDARIQDKSVDSLQKKKGYDILEQTYLEYEEVVKQLKELDDAHFELLKLDVENKAIRDAKGRIISMYDMATQILTKGEQDIGLRMTYVPIKKEEDLEVEAIVMLVPGSDQLDVPQIVFEKDADQRVTLYEKDVLKLDKINGENVDAKFHDPIEATDASINMGPIPSKHLRRAVPSGWGGSGAFYTFKDIIENLSTGMIDNVQINLDVPGYNFQDGTEGEGYYWIGEEISTLRSGHGVDINIKNYPARYDSALNPKWTAAGDENYKIVTRLFNEEYERMLGKIEEANKKITAYNKNVQILCCGGGGNVKERFASAQSKHAALLKQMDENRTDVARSGAAVQHWKKRILNKAGLPKATADLSTAENALQITIKKLHLAKIELDFAMEEDSKEDDYNSRIADSKKVKRVQRNERNARGPMIEEGFIGRFRRAVRPNSPTEIQNKKVGEMVAMKNVISRAAKQPSKEEKKTAAQQEINRIMNVMGDAGLGVK